MSGQFQRVLAFEGTRLRSNSVVILGVVFALLFIGIVSLQIGRNADTIMEVSENIRAFAAVAGGQSDANAPTAWFVEATDPATRELFSNHSPLLSALFYVVMIGVPWFASLVGADQTSSDLGRKHIRFLLPRVRRRTLFLARFVSAWLCWVVVSGAGVLVACVLLTSVGPQQEMGDNLTLMLRIILVVSFYGLPFVAMAAFANTFVSNAFLVYLLVCGIWLTVNVIGSVGSWISDSFEVIHFLAPGVTKYPLMSAEAGRLSTGLAGAGIYTLIFLFFGDLIFRKRDV